MGPYEWRSPAEAPAVETEIGDEAVPTAVVETVAAVSNGTVTELPPLQDAIDPDALDALFTTGQAHGSLAFEYHGFLVVVTAAGTVAVHDAEDTMDQSVTHGNDE